jgi:hypothetical protein
VTYLDECVDGKDYQLRLSLGIVHQVEIDELDGYSDQFSAHHGQLRNG